MLAKGIKFYVGKFELSDMKISLRLTIEDNRNGTLNISKWIKSKGEVYGKADLTPNFSQDNKSNNRGNGRSNNRGGNRKRNNNR